MNRAINFLESINEWAGKIFAWATLILVLLISFEVVLRYLFKSSIIWMVELEIYFFAFSFLFASGYAFKYDKHVRVDVFYDNKTEKQKAWINLLGGIFFLIPWCVISIIACYKYASISFNIREVSNQPGGLPAVYLLKFSLVLGFTLLLIQALVSIMKSGLVIQQSKN